MSNIYYKIELTVDDDFRVWGPYLSLEEATDILADHIPAFAHSIATRNKYRYEAKVLECTLTKEGLWKKLNTLIVDNKCTKWKKKTQPPPC